MSPRQSPSARAPPGLASSEEISRLAFSNIGDVLTVEDGKLVVKHHAALDRNTLSTVAEVTEVINDKGYRTLRVK